MYLAQVYRSPESLLPNSVQTNLRPSPSLKLLSRLIPFCTVSPLDISATHGPGVTSSLTPLYRFPLNPERLVSFKLNARGTPAELFELTYPSGKIPPYIVPLKCSTSPQSPKELP